MVPTIVQDAALMAIAKEWQARRHDLADWTWKHLVNRTDIWGQYTGKPNSKWKALTMPPRDHRGEEFLTKERLDRHFGTLKRNQILGIHSQDEQGMCRWMAIDVDLHDAESFEARETAARNLAAAAGWWENLSLMGYDPLLFDSNGAGGYHIWVIFSEPARMEDVYLLAQSVISDWQSRDLGQAPETFPKSDRLTGNRRGNWLRLPGLHHTRNHFTRVWSGDGWLEDPWLEGNEAINQILSTIPGQAP